MSEKRYTKQASLAAISKKIKPMTVKIFSFTLASDIFTSYRQLFERTMTAFRRMKIFTIAL